MFAQDAPRYEAIDQVLTRPFRVEVSGGRCDRVPTQEKHRGGTQVRRVCNEGRLLGYRASAHTDSR